MANFLTKEEYDRLIAGDLSGQASGVKNDNYGVMSNARNLITSGQISNPYIDEQGSTPWADNNFWNWERQKANAFVNNDAALNLVQNYATAANFNKPQTPAADVTSQPASVKMDPGPYSGLRSISAQIKYDKDGRPIRNDYLSMTDQQGNLLDQYAMSNKIGDDVEVNSQGLDEIRNRALSEGPSVWASLALEKQKMDEANQLNQSNRQSTAAMNSAFNALQGRGGLSAGQKERLALQGSRNQFQNAQNIRNNTAMGALDIQMQDQKTKDSFLSQLPSADLAMANFNQGQRAYRDSYKNQDIGNAMKDVAGFNAYNSDAYGKAMTEWGTAKTADAQAQAARSSSGGGGLFGGCFLTTACCEVMNLNDDCWVLTEARRFRDTYMHETPERADEILEYYESAPKLVEEINTRKDAKSIWKRLFWKSIIPFVKQVRAGNLQKAHLLYNQMINTAKSYSMMEAK